MEVSQFTYFQQVGGHDCKPVSGELTYGLERLAMYVLGVDHVMDMPFNDPQSPIALTYGDVFKQTEEEYARWNFDVANTEVLLRHFEEAEAECEAILAQEHVDPKTGKTIIMAHPAYDQCIKASHIFNLLALPTIPLRANRCLRTWPAIILERLLLLFSLPIKFG